MIETGVVINVDGEAIYWHQPPGRTAVSIPDTRLLWDVLWEYRKTLWGFAHSHPGSGIPKPSLTDLSTFLAIEQALGRHLSWWITSTEKLISCTRQAESQSYRSVVISTEPPWAGELRLRSEVALAL